MKKKKKKITKIIDGVEITYNEEDANDLEILHGVDMEEEIKKMMNKEKD
jgi:hypothetical protein